MKKITIIWDFDGTILPHEPYDSEQSLLIHVMNRPQKPFGWLKKRYANAKKNLFSARHFYFITAIPEIQQILENVQY